MYIILPGANNCYISNPDLHHHHHSISLFRSPSYTMTPETVLNEQRHVCEMAALVRYFPTGLVRHLVACVEGVRCRIAEVADVLDAVALFVVGDVPAHFVDQGHVSSVAERDL